MNNLTTNLFISSKEISSLTDKNHSAVLFDIRNMISELEKEDRVFDSKQYQVLTLPNKMTQEILLNRRLTEILVTGYSIVLRARVIDRLHELEANQFKIPQTYTEALQAHLESTLLLEAKTKEVETLNLQIEIQAPLVHFAETVSNSTTNLDMTTYSQLIHKETKLGRNQLFKFLRDKKIFKANNTPYQNYINKGYFKVVESVTKSGHISIKTTITPLGQQKLLTYLKKQNT